MELINQTTLNKKVDVGNTIRLQDVYRLFVSNWYWFVLSLLITVGATVAYLLVTPPVYTRSASILIKDDGKGGGISGGEANAFSDLGMFKVKTNVNNEMISLKSPAVIQEVVRRLHLNISYQSDGRFHRETLYGTSLPVTVDFKNLADNDAVGPESDGDGYPTEWPGGEWCLRSKGWKTHQNTYRPADRHSDKLLW